MPFADPAKLANEICKRFLAEGKLIEAGFAAMQLTVIHKDAPPEQIREMRMAFFAGAQHLWGTVMNVLDPGGEPTDADYEKMELIQKELDGFIKELVKTRLSEGQA